MDILKDISNGLLNKEIADKHNIVEGSVKLQISSIYKKLQVNNRVEAVTIYNQNK
jgi:DNA-binding NarL/FixJ family response regulator